MPQCYVVRTLPLLFFFPLSLFSHNLSSLLDRVLLILGIAFQRSQTSSSLNARWKSNVVSQLPGGQNVIQMPFSPQPALKRYKNYLCIVYPVKRSNNNGNSIRRSTIFYLSTHMIKKLHFQLIIRHAEAIIRNTLSGKFQIEINIDFP